MRRFLVLLIAGLSLWCSCGKIELPEPGRGNTSSGEGSFPGSVGDSDTLTVAQLAACPDDDIVIVKGYIVGYISGNTINTGATFGLPDDVNTNMLLADSPDETDIQNCVPVRLEKSENYGYRSELNMYDNPQNYRRCILLLASVGSYFRVKGITRVHDYRWMQAAPDSEPPAEPGAEPEPVPNPNPESEPRPEVPEPGIVFERDTLINGL